MLETVDENVLADCDAASGIDRAKEAVDDAEIG
jgi:hypothetical protein